MSNTFRTLDDLCRIPSSAPTTRETADHAELLAGEACGDRMLAVADALMPWLKNYPPSTRRERAIEAANAAIAASCAPLLSEIAALRGERDTWKAMAENGAGGIIAHINRATQAERQRDEEIAVHTRIAAEVIEARRQRDELRKALDRIKSGRATVTECSLIARQALINQGAARETDLRDAAAILKAKAQGEGG